MDNNNVNKKIRTPQELQDIRFNYFEAFTISLNETNTDTIKKRIQSVSTSKANTSDPVNVRIGKELRDDAIEVMVEDSVYQNGVYVKHKGGRAQEAKRYKDLKLKPVVEVLMNLAERGVLYKSEIIQAAEKNKLEVSDVEAAIKFALKGIKFIDDTQSRFDFKTYIETEKYYTGLSKPVSDLYQLLDNIPQTSSLKDIQKKLAECKSRDAVKMGGKGEGTSLKNLYGCAEKIFKEEGDKENVPGRRQYVTYLQIRDDVFNKLKAISETGIEKIQGDDYLRYLDFISKKTAKSIPEAEKDLAAILKFLKLKLSGSIAGAEGVKIEICPYAECGKPYIYVDGMTVCPSCGKPFVTLCWNCQSQMRFSSQATVCPKCGLSSQMQSVFDSNNRKLISKLQNPRISTAELKKDLGALKGSVPGYEKMPESEAYKKITFLELEIDKKSAADESKLKKYIAMIADAEAQIAQKKYNLARATVERITRELPGVNQTDVDNYNLRINNAIQKSSQYLNAAKRAQASGDINAAINSAISALNECSDNADAQKLINQYPPEAPEKVIVRTSNGKIIVEWSCRSGSTATYTVVRKVGSPPKAASDGMEVVKSSSVTYFEDTSVLSATVYYYGVYSERFGAKTGITVCNSSAMLLPDVINCVQEMAEGKIVVKWTSPSNVQSVEVRKTKGDFNPENGQILTGSHTDGFNDTDCDQNGNSYYVRCIYSVNGRKEYSSGVRLFYKPFNIPASIGAVSVESSNEGVLYIKAPKAEKDVGVYLSKEILPVAAGKPESISKLPEIVKKAEKTNGFALGDGKIGFAAPEGFTGFVYLFNTNEQLFVASEPVLFTSVKVATGVTYTESNGNLKINFKTSPAITSVIVKIGETEFPKQRKDKGREFVFSGDKVRQENGLVVMLPDDMMAHVSIFGEVRVNGMTAVTMPVMLDSVIDRRKKQIVRYALEYNANPVKPFSLTVKFESDAEVDLSGIRFAVFKGSPRPMNRNSGTFVKEEKGPCLRKGIMTHGLYAGKISLTIPPMAKHFKLAMFFADDSPKIIQLREAAKL